jgi:hypothetical protein
MTHDELHEDNTDAIVNAFLQNNSMEQARDYLARGRRFAQLDIGQLNQDWIIAVKSWLARKEPTNELIMDDLASELALRKLEPPYDAVRQELIDRLAQTNKSQRKKKLRVIAREIDDFLRENEHAPLNRNS